MPPLMTHEGSVDAVNVAKLAASEAILLKICRNWGAEM